MNFIETATELSNSLVRDKFTPLNGDELIARWRAWMKMIPGHDPEDMHSVLVARHKRHFRYIYDAMMVIDKLDEDSPLREHLEMMQHMAFVELRRADFCLVRFEMEFGVIAAKDDVTPEKFHMLALAMHSLQERIYDEMWQINRKQKVRQKMPLRGEVVGDKPRLDDSWKLTIKTVLKSFEFMSYFCEKMIGDLMCIEGTKIDEMFWKDFVRRSGLVMRLVNEIFYNVCDQ